MASAHERTPGSRESFAQLLRAFRLRAGLSQADLAAIAHLSARTISDLERGVRKRAYLPTVHALALALALTPEERQRFSATVHRARARRIAARRLPAGSSAQLPDYPSSFIGRDRELAMLQAMLARDEHRLVTVTGPPGVGKSRLAIETARTYGSGVLYVSPGEATPSPQVLLRLAPHLRQADACLLVIDNFERLNAATSEVQNLLRQIPEMRVLATSRFPSRLPEEQELHLQPLSTTSNDHAAAGDAFMSSAARLFLERLSGTPVAEQRMQAAIDALAHRLDGLPLAIEAAAAYIREHPVSLGALEETANDVLLAVRNVVEASTGKSYDLLSPLERQAFRHVALFQAEWSIDDALDLLTSLPTSWQSSTTTRGAFDALHAIEEHSLVQLEAGQPSVRFRMVGLIRDFALRLLQEEGEAEAARRALLECALRLCEGATALASGDAATRRSLLLQRSATVEAALQDCDLRRDVEASGQILWGLRHAIVEDASGTSDRWIRSALSYAGRSPLVEGRLLVLSACLRAMRGDSTGASRDARNGLSCLKSRPADRDEALRLLPESLVTHVREKPDAPFRKAG